MKTVPAGTEQKSAQNIIEWTGLAPIFGTCPGVQPDGTIHSLPLLNFNSNRQQILDYFNNTWTLTEVLFSSLTSEEAFYRRPYHQLRHPLIFYYAHPAVLYVNKLRVAGLLDHAVHPEFEHLFEVGVDEMRWDDLHEGNQNVWPELSKVTAYRKTVYDLMCQLIKTHPLLEPGHSITQQSPLWALVMGFEHERIHLETSNVLMRELPIEFVRKPKEWPASVGLKAESTAPRNAFVSVPGTTVTLGKPTDWPSFGWDNEYGSETHACSPFSTTQFLISNGEFLEFVTGGGYLDKKYWSQDGWDWRGFRNTRWPTFWVQVGPAGLHQYSLRTTFEVIPMQWDWPVCVNFHEAKAYCAWRTEKDHSPAPYRLLHEVEHQALRDANVARDPVMTENDFKNYNLNLSTGSESPVDAYAANNKGIFDSFGNVWQWCEDAFHPLNGGKPHPYYEDFSVPCYDGRHQMILGGSFTSTGDEASIWARFHFRPHFFQHAGFRLVRSEKALQGSANYESQEMINRYLLMHWGTDEQIWGQSPTASLGRPPVVHLPMKCAELVEKYARGFDRALDLGCAVGRSSFEMARHFKQVIGIDFSREFVDCAQRMKDQGSITYRRKNSGSSSTEITSSVDKDLDRKRVSFQQGDACALPAEIAGFDAVLLANVLCRLPTPSACLERMQSSQAALVKPGGILVMTTPFSWLEEYTPKSQWMNGLADVQKILTDFELIHQEELPFLIREHQRKFEYIITLASVWRRKGAS